MSERKKTSRFGTVNSSEKNLILSKRKAPNTNKATRLWLTCFTDYLLEKDLPKIENISTETLPFILEQFYSEVRKKESTASPPNEQATEEEKDDAKLYKNTTLKAIRAALTRYFKETKSIDIINNESFIRANEIFDGMQKINKEKGKGNVISKPPIDDCDLMKISHYFRQGMNGPPNPSLLQEVVLFYVLFYMCRRGRENLRTMTKNTFAIATDPHDGREYIYQAVDEADKNHSHKDTSKSNDGRIYAVPDSETCPVNCFKLYIGKLHRDNNWLWQRPKKVVHDQFGPWFDNSPIGKNTLDNFMKTLSKNAETHTIYTNHCIRATSITTWDENNIQARHIIGVSGHKSEETIRSYSRNVAPAKKREMADILSTKMGNPPKKAKGDDNNFGTINMEDIDFEDWVPIENNRNDFDLGDVLNTIENERQNNQGNIMLNTAPNPPPTGQMQPTSNENINPTQFNQIALPNADPQPSTSHQVLPAPNNPGQTNNQVLNFSSAQNYPLIPKMYFPNSNVTINYNFGAK